MPCRLKIRVISAQGLGDQYTYVEVKHGDLAPQKTKSIHSTAPQWKEHFVFEVAKDKRLQDVPVELKLYSQEYMTAESIGNVLIDLNSLLTVGGPSSIEGWFAVHDSLKGIRAWIQASVRLDFFDNASQFKNTSAGVKFFSTSQPMHGYTIGTVFGFVEELIVEDDPEYHWRDQFRASRITNHQRQMVLYQLSGKLRRKMGLKVQEMGGNAVLAYSQHFDLEGEGGGGIVARGQGTAVILSKRRSKSRTDTAAAAAAAAAAVAAAASAGSTTIEQSASVPTESGLITRVSSSVVRDKPPLFKRIGGYSIQLVTLSRVPAQVPYELGGTVTARSVKLLKSSHRRRTRDKWWNELREEIRAHARELECHHVFGYTENTTILDELCVLTASGTAVRLELETTPHTSTTVLAGSSSTASGTTDVPDSTTTSKTSEKEKKKRTKKKKKKPAVPTACSACHVPYSGTTVGPMRLARCACCNKANVPEILFATIEPPADLQIVGKPTLIQSRVCRIKKKHEGEGNAIAVSEAILFLEYDLHKQLMFKLESAGMNACFGLKFQLTVGDNMIVGLATGTAMCLAALPLPPGRSLSEQEALAFEGLAASSVPLPLGHVPSSSSIDEEISEDAPSAFDFFGNIANHPSRNNTPLPSEGNAQYNSIQVGGGDMSGEGAEEERLVSFLDPPLLADLAMCNIEVVPGAPPPVNNLQLLVMVYRVEWNTDKKHMNQHFSALFQSLMRSITFKVFGLLPCTIYGLDFNVQLPSSDQIQIVVNAIAASPAVPVVEELFTPSDTPEQFDDDVALMFSLEGLSSTPNKSVPVPKALNVVLGDEPDHTSSTTTTTTMSSTAAAASTTATSTTSSSGAVVRGHHQTHQQQTSIRTETIEVTPLSFVAGCRVRRYVGRVNVHLIKESFSGKDKRKGLSTFTQIFIQEALSIARAHVSSMGGNALIGFKMESVYISDDDNNYCLISLSGDAVCVRPRQEDPVGPGFEE